MPLIYKLPSILKGISLIYFIKNQSFQSKNLSSDKRDVIIAGQEVMFKGLVDKLKETKYINLQRMNLNYGVLRIVLMK